jgi:hypothetical protein
MTCSSTSKNVPKRKGNMSTQMFIHSSKLETNQTSNGIMAFLCSGTLFSKKRNALNTMDESQKHCAKRKKPDTEDYVLHDSAYMKF